MPALTLTLTLAITFTLTPSLTLTLTPTLTLTLTLTFTFVKPPARRGERYLETTLTCTLHLCVLLCRANGKGFELRPWREGDSQALKRRERQRVSSWRDLSIGELYVFLGLRLVMGAHWRPQLSDYWASKDFADGYPVPLVKTSMREDRYKEILANLSFLMPDDTWSYQGCLLRKLRLVDDALLERAKLAWDPEPECCADEQRCPLNSRFAKKLITTLWCKPIKVAVNNYLITFRSGYTWRWQWWDGKASRKAMPKGQPTDTGELNEESEEELGYIMQLIVNLTDGLEGTGTTIFLDKAFSSVRLARLLSLKGIAMVGMTRGARPKTMKLGPENYFAYRKRAKADADNLQRWNFRRVAYTPLPEAHERDWWLSSEVWLDKSFVTLLNTGWFSSELRAVPRWSDADGKKVKRSCSLALYKYSKGMGSVDRVNKEVALARMALGKCPRRFQRQLFLASDFPIVGLCNVRVAFGWLEPELKEQVKVDAGTFGYNRRFQLQLGENVVRHGIDWCKHRPGETFLSAFKTLRDDQDDGPHFMPERIKSVGLATPSARAPKRCQVVHEHVNTYTHPLPVYEGKRKVGEQTLFAPCVMCLADAKLHGTYDFASAGDQKKRWHDASGKRVNGTHGACNKCKVNLCEACFDSFDHERGRVPPQAVTVGGPSSSDA